MNCTLHSGRLARDPELTYVGPKNTALCKFSLPIPDKLDYKAKEKILWLNFTAWGTTAEAIAKHFVKGQDIVVRGRLSFSKFTKDGVERTNFFVTVEEFSFVGGNKAKAKADDDPMSGIPF